MRPVVDEEKCVGCGACVAVCPASPTVFEMKDVAGKGMKSIVKNPKACIGCGSCVSACPVEAIKLVEDKE
ncbi:MAG TPA: 4Fe-4S dicluster domain-containing protein [Candidatus Altiarchaeales archaeon]|nr:4Fe-4S dicluster domain-containing protein [Candidatus Altiarchaeales archaeon]